MMSDGVRRMKGCDGALWTTRACFAFNGDGVQEYVVAGRLGKTYKLARRALSMVMMVMM